MSDPQTLKDTLSPEAVAYTAKDFRSPLKPIWCSGCGAFGVVMALCRALAAVGRPSHEIAFISGIGCSSRIPGYTNVYGFNSVHGRALPIAQGIKLANPDLLVLAAGGDGDGFSIGGNHVAHAARRNVDLTYICMDNQIYGLTKGQLSPTSPRGLVTVTSPYGSFEEPVNPLSYVLSCGAGFVAQGCPANMKELGQLIEEGIRYPGFAFINIQAPCVTFGEDSIQLRQLKAKMQSLEALNHDPADILKALEYAQAYGEILYHGVLFRRPEPPLSLDREMRKLQDELKPQDPSDHILDLFLPG